MFQRKSNFPWKKMTTLIKFHYANNESASRPPRLAFVRIIEDTSTEAGSSAGRGRDSGIFVIASRTRKERGVANFDLARSSLKERASPSELFPPSPS